MRLIKGESSFWINKQGLTDSKFEWSDEYFAVSVSDSHVNRLREYVKHQDKHHAVISWQQEYNQFVKKYRFDKMVG